MPTVSSVSPEAGPDEGGTELTITGSGFTAGTPVVDFDGLLAKNITVVSDTELTCTTPRWFSISPATGDEAGGTSVTITGSGFNAYGDDPSDDITFGGTSATNITVVSDTEITCDTPAGAAGDADVVVIVNGDDSTLSGGFEYTETWTLAELNPDYWYNDNSDITESGTVSQWNDLSGNDYHVSQASGSLQPTTGTQNGRRILTFDDDRLDFPSGAMGVYRDVPYAWCLVVRKTDNPSVTAHAVFWQHGAGTGARFNISSANNASRAGGRRLDADGFESVVSGAARTDWVMHLAILDYDNRSLHVWVDGVEVDSQTNAWSGSGNSSDTDSLAASIGDAPQGTAGPLEGDMGEVAGGGAALSSDDIDKIFGYAAHRWGLEDNLDAAHPYKSSPP